MSKETKKSDTHDERYAHIKVEGHPRVYMATVFARRTRGGQSWFGSVAFCAHGDQFNRRLGRQMARRRFFLAESHPVIGSPWFLGPEFTFAVAEEYVGIAVQMIGR